MLNPDSLEQILEWNVAEAKSRPFTTNEGIHRKKLVKMVMKAMGWDNDKTKLWFSLDNPHFGGISPDNMVKIGRGHKVEAFIRQAKEENGK